MDENWHDDDGPRVTVVEITFVLAIIALGTYGGITSLFG